MEIQDTPIYLDTRENYTNHDEFDISNAIEPSPHTQTAGNLQNTTSPTLDSSIHFLPKLSTSYKSREQSVSDEEHSTALGLDIPTTNRTSRMIRRQAWHYDYDFCTDETVIFQWLLASMAMFHSIMTKHFCQLMLKTGKL